MLMIQSDDDEVKTGVVQTFLRRAIMTGRALFDYETSQPISRVVCEQCGWKYEGGEGVRAEVLTAHAIGHRKSHGHTAIRVRFDILNLDGGPVPMPPVVRDR